MEKLSSYKMFGGQQEQYKHASAALGCEMQFSIFLPPQVGQKQVDQTQVEQQNVPVLYWLSGLTCTDQNFVTKAGAQKYATELGVAIVCPDTSPRGEGVPDDPESHWDFGLGAGFYVNATEAPWQKNYQMVDYVVNELPELVNTHFPVNPLKTGISGHSMGGHGALTIGLKNPNRYKSISAFAPIVSPLNCPWGGKALGNYLGENRDGWTEYDACSLIKKADVHQPILIDQGMSDNFLEEQLKTELLVEASEKAGYPMNIRFQEGYDHSFFFIASFIEEHIRFHADALGCTRDY